MQNSKQPDSCCFRVLDIWFFLHSDLEKSVEELQRNSSINHGLVTEQDVEQKSKELRMLGDTLTELKRRRSKFPVAIIHQVQDLLVTCCCSV